MRRTTSARRWAAWATVRCAGTAAMLAQATGALAGIDFAAGDPVGVASVPQYILAADLTEDGRDDVVVVSPSSREVRTFIAADTPSHLAPAEVASFGQELRGSAVGDFDADGRLDLVVAVPLADGIWLLAGRGDATLQPARAIGVPNSIHPIAVAAGNFDDTGHLDLAIADSRLGQVFIMRNDNTTPPCFVGGGVFDVGEEPTEIRSADLNRDGKADIVTLNIGGAVATEVTVALRRQVVQGLPESEAVQRYAVGERPSGLVTVDFNDDGAPDLAVLNGPRASDGSSEVRVLLNHGDGTFEPAIVMPIPCPFFTGGVPCRS